MTTKEAHTTTSHRKIRQRLQGLPDARHLGIRKQIDQFPVAHFVNVGEPKLLP